MTDTPDILKKILVHKCEEVEAAKARTPLSSLRDAIRDLPPTLGFERRLRAVADEGTAIIAEVKKGSPSRGVIRADFDHLQIARIYEENGAACLSVLTDERFFLGHLDYLREIRAVSSIPLLRKEFVYDPYQVYEARAAGGDAILLIAAMLEPPQIVDLASLASELSLDVLLEVHDERELETALSTTISLIGINNRNLRTFVTDLGATERLTALIPDNRFVVAESGINGRADIARLSAAGARAFLIGESMMRESDIGAKLRELHGKG